uniref:Strictosidine synthase conserved region domain-containing protein n=1 Tax=Leersia perrieri TaxID=77586 RepID=A0A0D9WFP5_9ORYZ
MERRPLLHLLLLFSPWLLLLLLQEGVSSLQFTRDDFPDGFTFGAGTAAYQYEGAAAEDGRRPSIWDTYAHSWRNPGGETGDVACDGYHKYKIHAVLYHMDLPQSLQDEYGGWVSPKVVDDFTAYADVCFREFGDRVAHWTTAIEPNVMAQSGYDDGYLPPNRCSYPFGRNNCTTGNSTVEPYLFVHHTLLAHASAVRLYWEKYKAEQKGIIGINIYSMWFYPLTDSAEDIVATERAKDFMILHPLVFGDYPETMKRIAGSRLLLFSSHESELITSAFDFIGLNHYISNYVSDNNNAVKAPLQDVTDDVACFFWATKNSTPTREFLPSTTLDPKGLEHALDYLQEKYGNLLIYIQENGSKSNATLHDEGRIDGLTKYIEATLKSIRNGANVKGFSVWSFMDQYEMFGGYKSHFGLVAVDFGSAELTRQPRSSARWYSDFLKNNAVIETKTTDTRWSYRLLLPDGVTGAESLAFDGKGGLYTGVSDGRVLRWGGSAAGWTTFASNTNHKKIPLCSSPDVAPEERESLCGRPLGIRFFRKTGELYIADAYMGLMKVGPEGGEAQVIATEADGVHFRFLNGLDVDQATGDVYFTDSSSVYTRRFNGEITMNADATGRLLKYGAKTQRVTVLKADLPYPNGVVVSRDRTHLVVAHTVPCQAFRYWLQGPNVGEYELFADLPGYPDNVRLDGKGGYWVALNQERMRLGAAPAAKHLVGVRLDRDGVEVEELTAAKGVTLSEVAEQKGRLWLGSVELDYIGMSDTNNNRLIAIGKTRSTNKKNTYAMERRSLLHLLLVFFSAWLLLQEGVSPLQFTRDDFPDGFVFGAGTSAYQYEGAAAEDGRSPSIWDTYTHSGRHPEDGTGDVASDGYHKYKEDVNLMTEIGLEAYRFTISWSRLIPDGRGEVNPKGLQFYNNMINDLVHVVLYHLDLPQSLQDEYGGWISPKVVDDFTAYADVCFREFGDRIVHWTTVLEPNAVAQASYDIGILPPNRCSYPFGINCTHGNSTIEPYLFIHHSLLAHASAVRLYREKYQVTQNGIIGINIYSMWFYPFTDSAEDVGATERTKQFIYGWILHPLVFGDYPDTMKKAAGSRLPFFSNLESERVTNAFDFIGLNHYSSVYTSNNNNVFVPGTTVDPQGLEYALEYIRENYGNLPIYIQENGSGASDGSLDDVEKINYLGKYISATLKSIRNGANVKGYSMWSFMDLYEIFGGYYGWHFGLVAVDFGSAERRRQLRRSASWYSDFLKNNAVIERCEEKDKKQQSPCTASQEAMEMIKRPLHLPLLFFSAWLLLLLLQGVRSLQFTRDDFPSGFVFGAGTSAYQYEGAAAEDGRSPSIWDTYTHSGRHPEDGTGDVASDGYHKYKEDVNIMSEIGLEVYRFTISWSRLIPGGRGTVNKKGLQFYNSVINEIVKADTLLPFTIWTFPRAFKTSMVGGLALNDDFIAYADLCFHEFGDRVAHWTTAAQKGIIGINIYSLWLYPFTDSAEDIGATERAKQFMILHPLVFGDYPETMKKAAGSRLPFFSNNESELVTNAFDFIGLNHYTSVYTSNNKDAVKAQIHDVTADVATLYRVTRDGKPTPEFLPGTIADPQGLENALEYIRENYGNLPIYIQENGSGSPNGTLDDVERIIFLAKYIAATLKAIRPEKAAKTLC